MKFGITCFTYFVLIYTALLAFNADAAKRNCDSCQGGSCPVPAFRTLTLEVPATAIVAPAPKATIRENRIVQKAKPVAVVAIAPAKAAVRVVEAIREREHKPVVNVVQAIRERERRPVANVVSAIRERKPLRSLLFRRR